MLHDDDASRTGATVGVVAERKRETLVLATWGSALARLGVLAGFLARKAARCRGPPPGLRTITRAGSEVPETGSCVAVPATRYRDVTDRALAVASRKAVPLEARRGYGAAG